MELVKKTFIQRLQYIQAELRAIAQSRELRQLVQSNHYDPDLTIIDAIHAVTEAVEAYEENCCVFQLQPGQPPIPKEIQNSFIGLDDDLGNPF